MGCICVFWFIYRYKRLRKTISTRLIFYQSCCYFIEALATLVIPNTFHDACTVQAVLVAYTRQVGVMWSGVIVYVIYHILHRPVVKLVAYHPNDGMLMFHVICWLLPIPIAVSPAITGEYPLFLILSEFMLTNKPAGNYGQLSDEERWCWVTGGGLTARIFRGISYGCHWTACAYVAAMSLIVWLKVCHRICLTDSTL